MINKCFEFFQNHSTFSLAIGIIALSAILFLFQIGDNTEGSFVVVSIAGEEYGKYSLSNDSEINIKSSYGSNLLQIRGGHAVVVEADCFGQDCVHMKEISRSGEQIICLPHKLVIRIEGREESDVDAVSG